MYSLGISLLLSPFISRIMNMRDRLRVFIVAQFRSKSHYPCSKYELVTSVRGIFIIRGVTVTRAQDQWKSGFVLLTEKRKIFLFGLGHVKGHTLLRKSRPLNEPNLTQSLVKRVLCFVNCLVATWEVGVKRGPALSRREK